MEVGGNLNTAFPNHGCTITNKTVGVRLQSHYLIIMERIYIFKWQTMSDNEVIEYWESHNYAETYKCEKTVSGFGFSNAVALDNYSNCKHQMIERGLL